MEAKLRRTEGALGEVLGMSLIEATEYCALHHFELRIGSEDGVGRRLHLDRRPSRITVTVIDGVITAARAG